MTKAQLARQLNISRAYVTMLTSGKRIATKKLRKRLFLLTGCDDFADFQSAALPPELPRRAWIF